MWGWGEGARVERGGGSDYLQSSHSIQTPKFNFRKVVVQGIIIDQCNETAR